MKNIILCTFLIAILQSCKKQELQRYSEKPMVYFSLQRTQLYNLHQGSTANTILVDFASKASTITTDTLLLRIQATGEATEISRPFVLVENSNTTSDGTLHEILNEDFLLPAGKFDTTVYVVVHRIPALTQQELSFGYELKDNEYFDLGPHADTTLSTAYKVMTELRIRVRDMVYKPTNWDSFIINYFGLYSEVKYRFIIDHLAKMEFASNISASTMRSYRTRLVTALNQYNASNTQPLQDENDNPITF